jgi:osmotically-inducible protein OsmY
MTTKRVFSRIGIAGAVLGLILVAAACQTMTGQTAGEYIDDKTITTQVKARLAAEQAETLTRVDVDTRSGTVYLTGTVSSGEQRATAERIARSQEGVKRVVNDLRVNPNLSR